MENAKDTGPNYESDLLEDENIENGIVGPGDQEAAKEMGAPFDENLKTDVAMTGPSAEKAIEPQIAVNIPPAPIFIGHSNRDFLQKVVEYIMSTDKGTDNIEIVLMSEELLMASTENWMMSKLSKEQQKLINEQRNNLELFSKCKEKAFECDVLLQGYLDIKNSKTKYKFSSAHLRSAFLAVNRKITHKETRELIDVLSIHNLISPTLLNVSYEKQRWEWTFDDVLLLDNTNTLILQARESLAQLENQLSLLEANRSLYIERIYDKAVDSEKSEADQTDGEDINTTGTSSTSESVISKLTGEQ